MLLKAGKYIIGRYFSIGIKEIIERYLLINTGCLTATRGSKEQLSKSNEYCSIAPVLNIF